jgi:tetratricopeptide (TPR) repeat protein
MRGMDLRRMGMLALGSALLLSAPGFAQQGPLEVTSGLGRKLYGMADDQKLIDARKALAAEPKNVDLVLKLSHAQASRRQYKEAVATDTTGIGFAPGNADLYLERGHRLLGLREFKAAKSDLAKAAELNPKLLDAHYHLGMAHYMLGEFAEAAVGFDKARALAVSDDSLIDCTAWLYVSLRRAGKEQEAAQALARITPTVKATESHLVFYLKLLRFYQGKTTAEAILPAKPAVGDVEGELSFDTVSYGVGNWYLYHHDFLKALGLFREVVKGEAWNSWGFIGSELELVRAANQVPAPPIAR